MEKSVIPNVSEELTRQRRLHRIPPESQTSAEAQEKVYLAMEKVVNMINQIHEEHRITAPHGGSNSHPMKSLISLLLWDQLEQKYVVNTASILKHIK